MSPNTHSGRQHGGRPGRRPGGRSGGKPTTAKSHAAIEPLHPTDVPPDIDTFRHWNLGDQIQESIAGMGITSPTPIQRLAIQHVLDGRDVIAKAETGTGKTLAFGAPMMAKIDPARASVLALALCPTRELAEQVQKVLAVLGEARGVKTALIVGGEPMEPQVRALQSGAQVVVGTPGRILDLYRQKFLSFPWTEFAILDEADVMLEIGFIDDVKQILSYMPDERQTLLFSATFPPELLRLAREYTKNPAEVATSSGVKTVDTIKQSWMQVDEDDQALALIRLIEQSEPEDVLLVFCNRRGDVDRLMRRLERMPFSVKALHGGYDQEARFRVMSAFRTGEVKALVATDVASRGLDVKHVSHVVNLGSPQDITDYTHRIGRTGRAGRSGFAITVVSGKDMHKWKRVLHDATWDIPEIDPPGSTRARGPRRGDEGRRDAGREAPRAADVPARNAVEERTPAPRERTARERPRSAGTDAAPIRRERPSADRSETRREPPRRETNERTSRAEHDRSRGRSTEEPRAPMARGRNDRWPEDRSEERTPPREGFAEWDPRDAGSGGSPAGNAPARRESGDRGTSSASRTRGERSERGERGAERTAATPRLPRDDHGPSVRARREAPSEANPRRSRVGDPMERSGFERERAPLREPRPLDEYDRAHDRAKHDDRRGKRAPASREESRAPRTHEPRAAGDLTREPRRERTREERRPARAERAPEEARSPRPNSPPRAPAPPMPSNAPEAPRPPRERRPTAKDGPRRGREPAREASDAPATSPHVESAPRASERAPRDGATRSRASEPAPRTAAERPRTDEPAAREAESRPRASEPRKQRPADRPSTRDASGGFGSGL